MPEGERIDLELEAELWRESLRWPGPAKQPEQPVEPEQPEPLDASAMHEGDWVIGNEREGEPPPEPLHGPESPEPREPARPIRHDASQRTAWRLAVATPIAMVLFLVTHLAVGIPTVLDSERYESASNPWSSLGVAIFFAVHGLAGLLIGVPISVFSLGLAIERWGRTKPPKSVVAVSGACGGAVAFVVASFVSAHASGSGALAAAYAVIGGVPPVVAGVGTPLLLPAALRLRWVRVLFVALIFVILFGLSLAWTILAGQ